MMDKLKALVHWINTLVMLLSVFFVLRMPPPHC